MTSRYKDDSAEAKLRFHQQTDRAGARLTRKFRMSNLRTRQNPNTSYEGTDKAIQVNLPQFDENRTQKWLQNVQSGSLTQNTEFCRSVSLPSECYLSTSSEFEERTEMTRYERQLELRNADASSPSPDLKKAWVMAKFAEATSQPPEDRLESIVELSRRLVANFDKQNSADEVQGIYEMLITHVRLASSDLTKLYFDRDLREAQRNGSSHLYFLRIIVPNLLDRRLVSDMFSFGFSNIWTNHYRTSIPFENTDEVQPLPKPHPDLTLFFKFSSLYNGLSKHSAAVNSDLGACIFPDSSATGNCFPFFFIEARPDTQSLFQARCDCMNSASQALFNIYKCLVRIPPQDESNLKQKFFEEVRVFAVACNSRHLEAYIYRARIVPEVNNSISSYGLDESPLPEELDSAENIDELEFVYDNIFECTLDSLDLCRLTTMVTGYAESVLFGILKEVHRKVLQTEVGNKKEANK